MDDASIRVLRSSSPRHSHAIGARLGQLLEPGDCVQLAGVLGAGKTTLAKGIARGMGIDPDDVTSPSFTLLQVYRRPDGIELVHVDGFRLGAAVEAETLGLEAFPGGILVVEWGDRLEAWLPDDRLILDISEESARDSGHLDEDMIELRRIEARSSGPRSRALLDEWTAGLGSDPVAV